MVQSNKTESELIDSIGKFNVGNRYIILSDSNGKPLTYSPHMPDSYKKDVTFNKGSQTIKFSDGQLGHSNSVEINDGKLITALGVLTTGEGLVTNYYQYILTALLVVLIMSSFIALRLSHFLMEPVEDLIKATSQISSGELSSRVKVSRDAELGVLANNFNHMANRLETTIIDSYEKHTQLEAILSSMNSGVIASDKTGKIIIFNEFARRIFGVFGDVIGKNLKDVIKTVNLYELNTVKDEYSELEVGKGETRHIRYKTTELNGDSNSVGKVTVLSDVTDLKKLENMRTQFVANVSHELKTPLTSIKGFSETLRDVHDEVTKNKFLDIIDAESERLRRLIDDILSLSSIENAKDMGSEIVDVVDITMDTCSLVELQAKDRNIDFALVVRGNPKIIGDIDKYKQLVINLVDNAIKYTESGGKVKVRLEETEENVVLSVSDTGRGIPEEHIPRLFERFYRVDKSRDRAKGGTGLGLAIVKHIVIGFDGDITVDSEVGKGTTFTVTLPVYRNENETPSNKIKSIKYNA